MKTRHATDSTRYRTMTTEELRDAFLVDQLFRPASCSLTYFELERAVVGSAVPAREELLLEASRELAAEYFCQRRELGVLNIGGAGSVDRRRRGTRWISSTASTSVAGAEQVSFASENDEATRRGSICSATPLTPTTRPRSPGGRTPSPRGWEPPRRPTSGRSTSASTRTAIESCQLVMGFTALEPGSVWNTMPPHTHARRTEVYLYFDLQDGAVVHLMGPPEETRHLIVRDGHAVFSPMWSIHSGAGTHAYTFCWGMGGENQEFSDMDDVPVGSLR